MNLECGLIPQDLFVFFNLADIALIKIHLDVSGQATLPDFLDILTKAQKLFGLVLLFFLP